MLFGKKQQLFNISTCKQENVFFEVSYLSTFDMHFLDCLWNEINSPNPESKVQSWQTLGSTAGGKSCQEEEKNQLEDSHPHPPLPPDPEQ